jgi:hypothetical protein
MCARLKICRASKDLICRINAMHAYTHCEQQHCSMQVRRMRVKTREAQRPMPVGYHTHTVNYHTPLRCVTLLYVALTCGPIKLPADLQARRQRRPWHPNNAGHITQWVQHDRLRHQPTMHRQQRSADIWCHRRGLALSGPVRHALDQHLYQHHEPVCYPVC